MIRFNSIQYLRAFASTSVILYHVYIYTLQYNQAYIGIFSYFKVSGLNGVLLFFTISGFIMAFLIDKNEKSFFIKRFIRIYPTYILAVILVIFVKVFLFTSITEAYLPYAMTLLPLEIMQKENASYPLSIEWTLIYEIFFYMICSILILNKNKKLNYIFMLIWLFIIIGANSFIQEYSSMRTTYDEIGLSLYNIPFIVGFCTYFLYLKIKDKDIIKISYFVLILLSVVLIVFNHYILASAFMALVKFIIISFVNLSVVILLLLGHNKYFNNKIILKVGDYSYGAYLIHASVIAIILSIFHKLNISLNTQVMLIVFLISFSLGNLFGIIDKKLYQYLKNIKYIN